MYYKGSTNTVNALFMLHDVDVGWERSEPNELVYNNYLLPMSLLDKTHMKFILKTTELEIVPSD
jgi:hypothetical protein